MKDFHTLIIQAASRLTSTWFPKRTQCGLPRDQSLLGTLLRCRAVTHLWCKCSPGMRQVTFRCKRKPSNPQVPSDVLVQMFIAKMSIDHIECRIWKLAPNVDHLRNHVNVSTWASLPVVSFTIVYFFSIWYVFFNTAGSTPGRLPLLTAGRSN